MAKTERVGEVRKDVLEYLVSAYVRRWGIDGSAADPGVGRALCPTNQEKDEWLKAMVKQIERMYEDDLKTPDVRCVYEQAGQQLLDDATGPMLLTNKQQYANIFQCYALVMNILPD